MDDAGQLWTTCTDLIRAQVSDVVWNTTFRELEAIDLTADELIVSVPSRVVKERIEARYLGIVRDALGEVNERQVELRMQVQVDEQALLGIDSTVLDLTTDDPRLESPELPDVPLATDVTEVSGDGGAMLGVGMQRVGVVAET